MSRLPNFLKYPPNRWFFHTSAVLSWINIATENKERKWWWKSFLKRPDCLLSAFFLTFHYFWSFSLVIQNIWLNLHKTNIWNGYEGIMKRNNNFLMNMIPITHKRLRTNCCLKFVSIVQKISYCYIDWEVLFHYVR